MTDHPAELVERCAKAALANHTAEVPSTTLSWGSHDGKAAAYASSTARAVLDASGHADLVAVTAAVVKDATYTRPDGGTNCRFCDADMDHSGTFRDMHEAGCVIHAARAALTKAGAAP